MGNENFLKSESGRKMLAAAIIAAVIYFLLIGGFASLLGRKTDQLPIEQYISHSFVCHNDSEQGEEVQGTNPDGTEGYGGLFDRMSRRAKEYDRQVGVEFFSGDSYGEVQKGETVKMAIPLTGEIADRLEELEAAGQEGALFFTEYHTGVLVRVDDTVLYDEPVSSLPAGRSFGNRYYLIPIPEGSEGRTLYIESTNAVNRAFSRPDDMMIIPATAGASPLLEGKEFIFITFLSLMIIMMIVSLFFMVMSIMQRKADSGMWFSMFAVLICAWYLGNSRLVYVICGNVAFSSQLEYWGLFAAPIPLAMFMRDEIKLGIYRTISTMLAAFYSLLFLAGAVLELSRLNIYFTEILSLLHISLILGLPLFIVGMMSDHDESSAPGRKILRIGIELALAIGVLEVIRTWLTNRGLVHGVLVSKSFAPEAILVMLITLLIFFVSRTTQNYLMQVEKDQLQELAYRDQLSQIPNRTAVYAKVEEMVKAGRKNYVMYFIDLNGLKKANDEYGHTVGDELLITIAKAIDEVFSVGGFCGRWGGDEFVACAYEDRQEDAGSRKSGAASLGKEGRIEAPCSADEITADAAVPDLETAQTAETGKEKEGRGEKLLAKFCDTIRRANEVTNLPVEITAACGYVRSTETEPLDPLAAINLADELMYQEKVRMKTGR